MQHISITGCTKFSVGLGDDRSPAIWAGGKCGWYEIRPPMPAYRHIFEKMNQGVSLYYMMQDVHTTFEEDERNRWKKHVQSLKQKQKPRKPTRREIFSKLDEDTMFLQYAVLVGDGSFREEVIASCDEHAPFIISQFFADERLPKKDQFDWTPTTFHRWLTERHPVRILQESAFLDADNVCRRTSCGSHATLGLERNLCLTMLLRRWMIHLRPRRWRLRRLPHLPRWYFLLLTACFRMPRAFNPQTLPLSGAERAGRDPPSSSSRPDSRPKHPRYSHHHLQTLPPLITLWTRFSRYWRLPKRPCMKKNRLLPQRTRSWRTHPPTSQRSSCCTERLKTCGLGLLDPSTSSHTPGSAHTCTTSTKCAATRPPRRFLHCMQKTFTPFSTSQHGARLSSTSAWAARQRNHGQTWELSPRRRSGIAFRDAPRRRLHPVNRGPTLRRASKRPNGSLSERKGARHLAFDRRSSETSPTLTVIQTHVVPKRPGSPVPSATPSSKTRTVTLSRTAQMLMTIALKPLSLSR